MNISVSVSMTSYLHKKEKRSMTNQRVNRNTAMRDARTDIQPDDVRMPIMRGEERETSLDRVLEVSSCKKNKITGIERENLPEEFENSDLATNLIVHSKSLDFVLIQDFHSDLMSGHLMGGH